MENTFISICGGGVRMRIQSKVLWGYAEYGDTLIILVLQKNAEIMFLLFTLKSVKHLSHMQEKKTQKISLIFIVSELWVDI